MQQSKEEYVYAYGIIKGTVYNTTNPKICHLWSKGSPAWRNNNPGMLPLSRNILRSGAIGVADEMAVFKNISAGDRAHRSFLEIECASMTVEEALYNSLPSDTEDVEEYIKETLERLNATEETLVSDISINELVEAIRKKIEWAKGIIKKIKNPRYIWRTMKDGNVRNKHIIREGLVSRVHIKENSLKEIKQSFKNAGIDFDSFPPSTRVALIDIHYNSGGVNKGKWPQMMEALQKYDLDSVAKRSNRGAPISKERNNEIARLIIHGKKELQHKLEIGTWR